MPPARPRSAAAEKPVELEAPFDIHAWLTGFEDGAEAPQYVTASVSVCLKPYLVTRLNELVDAIDAAESAERTMGDSSPAKLRREYDALLAEFEASKIVMKFRQTVPGDVESVRDDMNAAGVARTAQNINCWLMSRLLVDPQLSPREVAILGERIGAAQFQQMVSTLDQLAAAVPEVSVPKSLRP
jgi:hypothetical protein